MRERPANKYGTVSHIQARKWSTYAVVEGSDDLFGILTCR